MSSKRLKRELWSSEFWSSVSKVALMIWLYIQFSLAKITSQPFGWVQVLPSTVFSNSFQNHASCSRYHRCSLTAENMSSAPPAQGDQVVVGDVLSFRSSSYVVEAFLGEGTFGKVAKCTRVADLKTVAIKMMKKKSYFKSLAKSEVGKKPHFTEVSTADH